MDGSKKAVREFILYIALGFAVYVPLVCLGFLAAGRFELRVLSGALYGSAAMILYYLLFARAMAKAAGDSDPEAAKKRIQAAYSLRMLILVVLIGAGVFFSTDTAPKVVFHWLPIILSMIIPRISIAVWQIIQKKNGTAEQKDGDEIDGN